MAMAFFLYLLFSLDALGNSGEQRCESRLGFYHTSLVLTTKYMTIILKEKKTKSATQIRLLSLQIKNNQHTKINHNKKEKEKKKKEEKKPF